MANNVLTLPSEEAEYPFNPDRFSGASLDQLLSQGVPVGAVERTEWLKKFFSTPFPVDSDELWRYFKPEDLKFDALPDPTISTLSVEREIKGLSLYSGAEAFAKYGELIGRTLLSDTQSLSSLHTALLGDITVVEVRKEFQEEHPVKLTRQLQEQGKLSASLLIIVVKQGVSASLYEDMEGLQGFLWPRTEVYLEPASSLQWLGIEDTAQTAKVFSLFRAHAKRDAQGHFIFVNLGGEIVRNEVDVVLTEPGSALDVSAVTLSDGHRKSALFTNQQHLAPHCTSDLYAKAVLKDDARSVYFGYIRVAEEAQKTDAYQTSRNLVLSPSARADAVPNLEIKANDVKCSHGASVGQVSQEELFYLKTRGLTPQLAEQLLVEGFLTDLLGRVKDEAIHERLYERVMRRLHG